MSAISDRVRNVYQNLKELVDVVSSGGVNSLMVRGPGGLGKTFIIRSRLAENRKEYLLLQGYTSPTAFYNFMAENADGLIVIDDCDAVFKDIQGLNILKAVLDTYPVRRVSWMSPSGTVSTPSFEFRGQIIFATNLPLEKLSTHMSALLSRILVYPLEMTSEEVLYQIKLLSLREEYKGLAKKEKYRVYTYLKAHLEEFPNLNLRDYIKCLDLLAAGANWRKLIKTCR